MPMKFCKTENPTVLRTELCPEQDARNFLVDLQEAKKIQKPKKEIIAEETMEAIII